MKAAAISPDAKTYALMIGISKYQKLPQDLWLQFADADAKTFGQHLASPRGGGVPADQMLVLTNEQATTAAIRNAFQTFLKNRAGKKDTVFILIAGHGTVDTRGSYILTYDSDPQDLSTTAIPMSGDPGAGGGGTLQSGPRGAAGRCLPRRRHRQSEERGPSGSAVEKLGEAPGEMLGLMASRPKELSLEGTQYGGGHGAFTYSVLQGLEGARRPQKRPIRHGRRDYRLRARPMSRRLTNNKQHPRDFGNMENATKLSDLSKAGHHAHPLQKSLRFAQRRAAALRSAADPQARAHSEAHAAISMRSRRRCGPAACCPTDPGSAWDMLAKLRGELPPEQDVPAGELSARGAGRSGAAGAAALSGRRSVAADESRIRCRLAVTWKRP